MGLLVRGGHAVASDRGTIKFNPCARKRTVDTKVSEFNFEVSMKFVIKIYFTHDRVMKKRRKKVIKVLSFTTIDRDFFT